MKKIITKLKDFLKVKQKPKFKKTFFFDEDDNQYDFSSKDFLEDISIIDIICSENIDPDYEKTINIIRDFLQKDEKLKKIYDEYLELWAESMDGDYDNNSDIKCKELELEFYKRIFKYLPNELKDKFSSKWISENIGKKTSLLL